MTSGRTLLSNSDPSAYKTLLKLNDQAEAAAAAVGIEKSVLELVKIRVSQINGCAFCLRMHTRDALKAGESADRLAVLSAWRETRYFTDLEKTALAVAEEISCISDAAKALAPDDSDVAPLTKDQAAALRWVAIVINAFNRLAIGSHYVVKP